MNISIQTLHAAPTHPLGTLTREYSGTINTLSIGGSLRTLQDAIPYVLGDLNACQVVASSSANLSQAIRTPAATAITGLPAGSTILGAHLYWAGSYSASTAQPTYSPPTNIPIPNITPSNSLTPDYSVLLNGTTITSSKNMTDSFLHINALFYATPPGQFVYDYFGGYADVTSLVTSTGNAVYTFSGLTVNTQGYHCASYAVLAGWALHVVYKNAIEPFRVVKMYDGFQVYRDASINITPSGFTVPATPSSKVVITTWEGDEGNSKLGATFGENLKINVNPSTIPTFVLTGPLNPSVDATTFLPNQFNASVNTTNPTNPTALGIAPAPYGVDIDQYDISAQLATGQTSLTTQYSSGEDMVILSSEIMTLENDLFADLAITKTHSGDFGAGVDNNYTITVTNNGPLAEAGPINVVDTLPAGLNYVAVSGTGWTCSVAGSIISCSHAGPLALNASLPVITLTVNPTTAGTSVTNSVTVSGALTDNITLNNTATDLTNIAPPILTVVKSASAASADPGSVLSYNVIITNTGLGTATSVSQDDRLSKYTSLGIDCMPATVTQPTLHTINYTDGTPTSALTLGTLSFSNDNGVTFAYVPPALGGGVCTFDPAITHFKQAMTGTMPPLGTYSLQYQTQVK